MKKLGWGIGTALLIILAVIYSLKDTEEKKSIDLNHLQEKVTLQLTQLKASGFTVSDRVMQKEKEHFFITIVDPELASAYFTQRGLRITSEEAEELKDLPFSVDLLYLNDIFSLDIYPVALPPYMKNAITQEKDANILAQLEELIKRKVFFMHVELDHDGTTFKGHIKDIDETLQDEKAVKMQLLGLHFSGNIKEEKIVMFEQTFKHARLYMSGEVDETISGLQSSYALTGPTAYDYTSTYSIDQIKSVEDPENMLLAENLIINSTSKAQNGLARETLKATVKNADILFDKEKIAFKTLVLDMNINNIAVTGLDKLQNIDSKKEKEVDSLIETFVAKNMQLTISNLSAQNVVLHGKEVGGFNLDANLDIDQSLDIYRFNIQPKHAAKKMNGDIHVSISKEILAMLKEDPEFMILYMMYRPKRELGQRIYNINIGNGEIKINGKKVDF
jgi:hypothetical protein